MTINEAAIIAARYGTIPFTTEDKSDAALPRESLGSYRIRLANGEAYDQREIDLHQGCNPLGGVAQPFLLAAFNRP